MSSELDLEDAVDSGSHAVVPTMGDLKGSEERETGPVRLRILVAIASYGTNNDVHLHRLIREYRAMRHDVKLVVLSNVSKPLDAEVELRVGLPSKNPWSLPFAHKALFVERQDDYDLFIYSEDDTLLTEKHIDSFLDVSSKLDSGELAGFIRSEEGPDGKLYYSTIHRHYHWDASSVCERGGEVFAHLTNEHGACYVLTRPQLKRAIQSGGFAVPPHEGRYDMLVSAATDPYTQCGFKKLMCISRLDDFTCRHLTNKYVGRTGTEKSIVDIQIDALREIGRNPKHVPEATRVETPDGNPRWAKSYYEPRLDAVIDFFRARGATTVLSLGCGWGETEAGLVAAGANVTAIPLDVVIGRVAASKGVEVISASLEEGACQLDGRRFDGLFISSILHLVPDPSALLATYSSLICESGAVFISSPNCRHLAVRVKPWIDGWRSGSPKPVAAGTPRFSVTTVCRGLESAGIRVDQIDYEVERRWQPYNRLLLGLAPQYWASKFIVTASRLPAWQGRALGTGRKGSG
jgi:2-polyprenyl-3-methyl-5-hydroxy-6-metoxy-1,4-benzoquinol methylase